VSFYNAWCAASERRTCSSSTLVAGCLPCQPTRRACPLSGDGLLTVGCALRDCNLHALLLSLQNTHWSLAPTAVSCVYTLACISVVLVPVFLLCFRGLYLAWRLARPTLMHCSETISWCVFDLPANGCVLMTFLQYVRVFCPAPLRSRLPASPDTPIDACIRCLLEGGCLLERPACISYCLHVLHQLISPVDW
jgi:hypothetical protein